MSKALFGGTTTYGKTIFFLACMALNELAKASTVVERNAGAKGD